MDDTALIIRRAKRSNDTTLDLSGRGLSSIPTDVFNLANIETLILANNKISNLDYKINNLFNLKNLDLSNNSLQSLPDELLSLGHLQFLELVGNPLLSTNPGLKSLNPSNIKNALTGYFSGGSGSSPSFNSKDINDPAELKSVISKLQEELDELKLSGGGPQRANSRDWLNADSKPEFSQSFASRGSDTDVNQLRTQLRAEQEQVVSLKRELHNVKQTNLSGGNGNGNGGGEPGVLSQAARNVIEVDMNEVEMGQQISQGGFSVIYTGRWRNSNVVVKKIFDPVITDELKEEFQNEVEMMSFLRHPNVTCLMGVSSTPPHLAILLEYLPKGSLFDLLHKSSEEVTMDARLKIARDVANVFSYFHKSGVVHRDLKSHNVLFDDNNNIRICDFGLARHIKTLNQGPGCFAGTPAYMAPELLKKRPYDEKVDVFAFGVLLWELVTREIPYAGLEPGDVKTKIVRNDPINLPFSVPKNLASLIHACRDSEASKRPDFDSIVKML